jgi:hypothetical protein
LSQSKAIPGEKLASSLPPLCGGARTPNLTGMRIDLSLQSEMFERAKKENIIACMGTGSGKTLVSVMLLKVSLGKLFRSLNAVISNRPALPNTVRL